MCALACKTAGMDKRQMQMVEVLRRGVEQHQRGELNDARRSYLEFLRVFPENTQALHLLGSAEAQAGNLNAAESSLRKATRASDAQAAHCNTLATVLKQKDEMEEALIWFDRALELDPGFGPAWHNRGRLRHSLGQFDAATADLRSAAELMPGNARVHNDLGMLYESQAMFDEAVNCFEQAIRADAKYVYAHNNLGAIHLTCGRLQQAARCFEQAISCDAKFASAHDNLGLVLSEQGRAQEALACHARAAALAPERPSPLANQGAVLQGLGEFDEAQARFRAALALDEASPLALAGLAELHEWRGEYQEGLALVETPANEPEAHPDVVLACARLLRRVYRVPEAIDLLQPWLSQIEQLGNTRARYLHFTLGHLLDDEGCYTEAFRHFELGNRRREATFEPASWTVYVDYLIKTFSTRRMREFARAREDAVPMVFIVGMPRSGTSLAEQILAGHPQVLAAGERAQLGQLAHALPARVGAVEPYPICAEGLDQATLEGMSREYAGDLLPLPEGVDVVTDKMPLNFHHIGLAMLMFPNARFVHCTRDSMDTCLSCYFQDFPDPALNFSTRLRDTAEYYREYRRLMRHWASLPGLRMMELNYESLVQDVEGQTQALLRFLQLPWDDSCLRFYESARNQHTASHAQVRRPIYSSAVGRRHHYRDFLGDLRSQIDRP